MNVWWSRRRKRYSMERLRCLYADLLEHIDVTNEELGPRRAIMLDADGQPYNTNHSYYPWRHALFWNSHLWSSSGRRSIFSIHHDHNNDELEDDNINNDNHSNPQLSSSFKRKRAELASAFRVLSATRSADKEGDNFGAVAVRNDATVAALAMARTIEAKVVALIANIGDVVIQSDRTQQQQQSQAIHQQHGSTKLGFLRSDAVFEYFCEKAIFSLLIEIAKEKPTSTVSTAFHYNNSNPVRHNGATSCFHGVVWSPLVKAQVLQTVSSLVSSVRDMSALFYLLSNNYINELILCMLPTTQWTDPALVKIMPAYVQLLRNLTLQLVGSPNHLFPFMIVSRSSSQHDTTTLPHSFPLLSAALEVAMSSYAQSDSFVHLTCLHVIVNLLQTPQGPLRVWIARHADVEQKKLATHLSQRFVDRYHRLGNLCSGPVVDAIRSNSIVGQLTDLSDQLNFLNLLFSCDVLGLNVRVCETLLQRVVAVLLHHMLPKERHFLVVGVMDGDVIPRGEAMAHVSTFVVAQMMAKLEYTPLLRMLAVAIFHPLSPSPQVWHGMEGTKSTNEYILTPALNAVVQTSNSVHKNADNAAVIQNPFREQLCKALSGELGQWRFVSAAVLLESALTCDALDTETLASLEILPNVQDNVYHASSLEFALGTFLTREHQRLSAVSTMSLECAGSLALSLISQMANGLTDPSDHHVLYKSPVVQGLWKARNYFNAKSLEGSSQAGVSEIFTDLIESAVLSRYQEVYPNHRNTSQPAGTAIIVHGRKTYAYYLNRYGCQKAMAPKSGMLIRKLKGVSSNDVESARFYIQMALHFRSLCRVVEDLMSNLQQQQQQQHWDDEVSMIRLAQLDEADDLILNIGGLKPRPTVGMDLDLRGRMAFGILASAEEKQALDYDGDDHDLSRNGIFQPSSRPLVLVLDPADILVVQPMNRSEVNRGTVVCSIPLRSVIAFASDAEWLHLAIRNVPDVGSLIQNGNMALRFENVGTCLIVRQYIEQAKKLMRLKLMDQIHALLRIDQPPGFQDENTERSSSSSSPSPPDQQPSESGSDTTQSALEASNATKVDAVPIQSGKVDADHVCLDAVTPSNAQDIDNSLEMDAVWSSQNPGEEADDQSTSERQAGSDPDELNQSEEYDIERLLQLDDSLTHYLEKEPVSEEAAASTDLKEEPVTRDDQQVDDVSLEPDDPPE